MLKRKAVLSKGPQRHEDSRTSQGATELEKPSLLDLLLCNILQPTAYKMPWVAYAQTDCARVKCTSEWENLGYDESSSAGFMCTVQPPMPGSAILQTSQSLDFLNPIHIGVVEEVMETLEEDSISNASKQS